MSEDDLLVVTGLRTTFPVGATRVPVVDGVGFTLVRGQVLALVGESGCGKSVTALSVMRLIPKPGRIEEGAILFGGRDLRKLGVAEMRRVRGHGIAMIFQEPMTSLNPVMMVGDQVVEAIRLHERVAYASAKERAIAWFSRVGIPDPAARFRAFPHQLSGGLKQRVMIAMALALHSEVLIADEPTTALDVTIQAQILQLMRELQRDYGTAILLITHDLGVVNELADRVAVMYAGRIVEEGSREDIMLRAAHPYTRGLLAAIPGQARRGERLHEISGVVPSPGEWPSGCRFCTRCPRAIEECSVQQPPRVNLGQATSPAVAGHFAFCHVVAKERSP